MDAKLAVGLVLHMLCLQTESSSRILKNGLKTLKLEEIVPLTIDFYPERLSAQWTSETEFVFRDPGIGIRKYDASTGDYKTILSDSDLYKLSNYSVSPETSPNGKYVLLAANKQQVYRYSSLAEYWVYNLENQETYKIGQGPLQVVEWGNDNSLAYVQDNNVIYVPDVTHPYLMTNLTNDGVPGEIYNGAADWIYEEEVFNAAEAMWFSPNATYLAVARFNDSEVDSIYYPYYGNNSSPDFHYPKIMQIKYPKAGSKNPVVGLRVFKPDDLRTEPWIIPAPVDVVGIDHILGRVNWATDQNLIVLWLNRRQSISILVNCDLHKDQCSIIKESSEPNGWIDIHEPFFDDSGTKMVEIQPLYHGDRRFPHASRFDLNTLTTEDLSPGGSSVTEILGWNENTDTIYYIVAPETMPWVRQLWATCAGVIRCVSCKQPECRVVSGSFSPGARYGVVTCSASNIPPKTFLYDGEEDVFRLVKANARLTEKLSQYKIPLTLFRVVPLGDDVTAHVKLLLPPDMETGRKYPMVVRVYAGPGTTRVQDNFDLDYYNFYLAANKSYIVASIDGRGSGVMGVEAMHAVNRNLGTVEVNDTLLAIRTLVSEYQFIDPKNIGVWGWSYGGFASTMMLMIDDQKTLACAAAVAPVTSWLYYDTIYTERYMDLPENNELGYGRDLNSLAENLRGRKYLLIHGTGDDNVHFQHSMQLAKQLQRRDIEFEQMSYADENHSLLGVRRHLYHMLDHFWSDCFRS